MNKRFIVTSRMFGDQTYKDLSTDWLWSKMVDEVPGTYEYIIPGVRRLVIAAINLDKRRPR